MTESQPIAVSDVLKYLTQALRCHTIGKTYEIGGPDVLLSSHALLRARERAQTADADRPYTLPRVYRRIAHLVTPSRPESRG